MAASLSSLQNRRQPVEDLSASRDAERRGKVDPFLIAPGYKSPNFTPRSPTGKSVVIHSTRSGHRDNPDELQGTMQWFMKPDNVSAHLIIGKDGTIVRMVNDNNQAWHARDWNSLSWGIELCQGVADEPFTDAQYASLRVAIRHYHDNFGVPIVHATRDFIDGFIGHEEIPPGKRDGKTDPGPMFDWSRALDMDAAGEDNLSIQVDGRALVIVHNDVEILRIGDTLGQFPGRLAKLFGDTYFWLRKAEDGGAYWTTEEGD